MVLRISSCAGFRAASCQASGSFGAGFGQLWCVGRWRSRCFGASFGPWRIGRRRSRCFGASGAGVPAASGQASDSFGASGASVPAASGLPSALEHRALAFPLLRGELRTALVHWALAFAALRRASEHLSVGRWRSGASELGFGHRMQAAPQLR